MVTSNFSIYLATFLIFAIIFLSWLIKDPLFYDVKMIEHFLYTVTDKSEIILENNDEYHLLDVFSGDVICSKFLNKEGDWDFFLYAPCSATSSSYKILEINRSNVLKFSLKGKILECIPTGYVVPFNISYLRQLEQNFIIRKLKLDEKIAFNYGLL